MGAGTGASAGACSFGSSVFATMGGEAASPEDQSEPCQAVDGWLVVHADNTSSDRQAIVRPGLNTLSLWGTPVLIQAVSIRFSTLRHTTDLF
jgi:hypothetical protein